MKEEVENRRIPDFISPVLLSVVIIFAILRVLRIDLGTLDIYFIGLSIISAVTAILYFLRVRQLRESTSTPFSDTLVTLGGFYVSMSMISRLIGTFQLQVGYSLIFIVIGVFGRVLLLDRVVQSFFSAIGNLFSHLLQWTIQSPLQILRMILGVTGIMSLIFSPLGALSIPFSLWMFSLFFLIGLVQGEPTNSVIWFLSMIVIMFLLLFTLITSDLVSRLSYGGLIFSILLWDIGKSNLMSFFSWLRNSVPRFLHWIKRQIGSLISLVRRHPWGSLQITLLVLSVLSLIFLSDQALVGTYSQKVVFATIFLVLGILPTAVNVVKTIAPPLSRFLRNLFTALYQLLTNSSFYPYLFSISGIVALFIIPEEVIIYRIPVAIVTAVSISLLSSSYLMRFYDILLLGILQVTDFFFVLLPRLSVGLLQSFLSWISLFLFIFPRVIIPASQPYFSVIRWLFLILAIILWNTAYPHRRERFIRFMNRLTGGIFQRLASFTAWVIRNVITIGLVVLGFVFFYGSLGLIFPGFSGLVSSIFGNIMEDRLVSLIIGAFLFGMGIISIQQAQAKRSTKQPNGGDRK